MSCTGLLTAETGVCRARAAACVSHAAGALHTRLGVALTARFAWR